VHCANLAEPVPRTTSKPELGEILVFTDNRSEAASVLEFAGLLAEENGARLIGVFTKPAPHSPGRKALRSARAFEH